MSCPNYHCQLHLSFVLFAEVLRHLREKVGHIRKEKDNNCGASAQMRGDSFLTKPTDSGDIILSLTDHTYKEIMYDVFRRLGTKGKGRGMEKEACAIT